MKIQEAINILKKVGIEIGRSDDGYIIKEDDFWEDISYYRIRKLAEQYKEVPESSFEFYEIAKSFYPNCDLEVGDALKENYEHKGIILKNLRNLTKEDVRAAVVAYVRHNYTSYDDEIQYLSDSEISDEEFRKEFKDIEQIKILLGSE
ncbi:MULTISPECIES: hypothetical protein [Bacillati]|uniref:hypothetical protein n=1 Tax=Bacillati TaxID=1783272 RepID=UPI0022B95FF8|nr:hypothetical protein [Caldifermentibacillus hisashii]